MAFGLHLQLSDLDTLKDEELAQAEEQARQDDALEKLLDRFGENRAKKSWLVRNHNNRKTAFTASFFFNLISALAGLYGARILFQMIPVPIPYFEWVLAIGFLFVLEKFKRQFSDKFWDTWFATRRIAWAYALINFGLFGISLGLSVFGVYFAAKDFSPEANFIGHNDNPEVVALQDQYKTTKDELQALLDDPSSYNHEGRFYYNLIPTRTAKEERLTAIENTLSDQYGVITLQNEDILADWKARSAFRGSFSVVITLLSELLFEFCMAFGSYYDWRYCRAIIARRRGSSRREEDEAMGKAPALAG